MDCDGVLKMPQASRGRDRTAQEHGYPIKPRAESFKSLVNPDLWKKDDRRKCCGSVTVEFLADSTRRWYGQGG